MKKAKLTEEQIREKRRECTRKWKEKNKEKMLKKQRAYNLEYMEKNKEEITKKRRDRVKTDEEREKSKEYYKKYYQKNKEKLIKYSSDNAYGRPLDHSDQIKRKLAGEVIGIHRLNHLLEYVVKEAKNQRRYELIKIYEDARFEEINNTYVLMMDEEHINTYSGLNEAVDFVKDLLRNLL